MLFFCALDSRERFGIGIVFENCVMAGSDSAEIFHRAQELKTYGATALAAKRKAISCQQRSFVHQTMRVVGHSVNPTFWDQIPGPMLPFRTLCASQVPFRKRTVHVKDSSFNWQGHRPKVAHTSSLKVMHEADSLVSGGKSGIIAPHLTSKSEDIRILSVASNEPLKTTRQMLLEQQGYRVFSALTVTEVEALNLSDAKVAMALIGHGFRGPEKRKIARAVNHHVPGLPILEMCFHSPEIPGADFILTDSPSELVKAIKMILEGRRVRGYTD
jgi:hypothetical protein